MPQLLPVEFTFLHPPEWVLDEVPIGVRMKIENGVIFFKPASVGATIDVIDLYRLKPEWKAYMAGDHPMIERILRQLDWLGWLDGEFFELHPAQRGWHGISLKPGEFKPIARPYVRVRQVEKVPRRPRRLLHQGQGQRLRQRLLDLSAKLEVRSSTLVD